MIKTNSHNIQQPTHTTHNKNTPTTTPKKLNTTRIYVHNINKIPHSPKSKIHDFNKNINEHHIDISLVT